MQIGFSFRVVNIEVFVAFCLKYKVYFNSDIKSLKTFEVEETTKGNERLILIALHSKRYICS